MLLINFDFVQQFSLVENGYAGTDLAPPIFTDHLG